MDFKYFGDKYLELCDNFGNLTLNDIVDYELSVHSGAILPNELAFYINSYDTLINSIKCVKELNNSPKEKAKEILEKYKIKPKDIPIKSQNYIS